VEWGGGAKFRKEKESERGGVVQGTLGLGTGYIEMPKGGLHTKNVWGGWWGKTKKFRKSGEVRHQKYTRPHKDASNLFRHGWEGNSDIDRVEGLQR